MVTPFPAEPPVIVPPERLNKLSDEAGDSITTRIRRCDAAGVVYFAGSGDTAGAPADRRSDGIRHIERGGDNAICAGGDVAAGQIVHCGLAACEDASHGRALDRVPGSVTVTSVVATMVLPFVDEIVQYYDDDNVVAGDGRCIALDDTIIGHRGVCRPR